jgi:rhamnosyltransferase
MVTNICAIVVTFYPEIGKLRKVIEETLPQVNRIIIVDNSPSGDLTNELRGTLDEEKLSVKELGQNYGIAVGHNIGIEWAKLRNSTHVLLLDQDSIPTADMVSRLVCATDYLESQGEMISAVGPRYRDPISRHFSFFVRFGLWKFRSVRCNSREDTEYVPVDFLISSGSLISLKTLESIGGMDESLFIDHVDTEWFLRAKAKGFRAYGVCDAVMEHSLGDGTLHAWFGRWRHLPLHSPLRHYYIFRNSILLYKRRYAPAQWIVNDLVRLFFMFFLYSISTPPRLERSGNMLKGLWDGVRGVAGKKWESPSQKRIGTQRLP